MTLQTAEGRELVSVVVPTKNSARTLGSCLESVRRQSYEPIQLIVVDNGSVDESVTIAKNYADIVDQFGPERSAQRNQGNRLATGQYLLFLDSDMSLEHDVVAACVLRIQEECVPAVIIPEVTVGDGFWAHCRSLERSCYFGDDLIEAARFFSREAFQESGGFDEALTAGEDWDISHRVAGGRSLPRVDALILHDEGRLRLRHHLAKKAHYAGTFGEYLRKHRSVALRQSNIMFRRSYFRNWRKLLRHPILSSGMFLMKFLELAVAVRAVLRPTLRARTDLKGFRG